MIKGLLYSFFFLILFLFPNYVFAQTSLTSQVNVPYFSGNIPFSETGIFWFGKVTPLDNYSDVRVGYNDSELYLYIATFDRRLWFDTYPTESDLDKWDSVTLYLNLNNPLSTSPINKYYKFVAQLNGGSNSSYQSAYQGNGSVWQKSSTNFLTLPGWRGDALNNDSDDRGWAMTFHIPFSSLGLTDKPADGTIWGIGVSVYDRDDFPGSITSSKVWPQNLDPVNVSTLGTLSFGLPIFKQPQITNQQSITIRNKLNAQTVPDAAVGGYSVCGNGLDFWTQWGDKNYGSDADFNIQNQSDIADWPCFSKYYITFPLSSLPPNKSILSAKLTLHQFGNSDPSQAKSSLIQIFLVPDLWSDSSITWNNAPHSGENIARTWVDPLLSFPGWPGKAWGFNVSYAVYKAYTNNQPLNIVLYSADSDYHSGKYFVSSDTGDWNENGRPTLEIVLGDPIETITPSLTNRPPKPGDCEPDGGDSDIDIFDYNRIVSNFGSSTNLSCDFVNLGSIDIFDYNVVVSNFGT